MPRLNVYLPEETARLAERWRGRINLSEICARALSEELEAKEAHRTGKGLFLALRRPSDIERDLAGAFGLADAVVSASSETEPLRETLGRAAAQYLSQRLGDGAQLAIGGGRQMWCMVRAFEPRPLRISIAALGVQPNDPRVLHAHANTLTTLLWLLFSPRAEAHLVGSTRPAFLVDAPVASEPAYFLVGSCARFDFTSPFANLLDLRTRRHLKSMGAYADFAYQFLDQAGRLIDLPTLADSRIPSAPDVQSLATRKDARVVVVAGGADKVGPLQRTLGAKLCNVVITDEESARRLLKTRKS